jgi:hypothetical protein
MNIYFIIWFHIDSTQILIDSSSSFANTIPQTTSYNELITENDLVFTDDLFESYNKVEFDHKFMKKFRSNNKINSNYLTTLKNSCQANKINVLHININSVFNKEYELNSILMLCSYDIVSINESKLADSTKLAIFKHQFYNVHRRDRDRYGACLLVFVKNNTRS